MAAFHFVVMLLLYCEWAQKCSCRFKVCRWCCCAVQRGLSTQQVSTVDSNLLAFNRLQCEASFGLCSSRDTHDFYFFLQFISADVYGICSRLFCDFGDEFEVLDTTGEEPKEIFISNITQVRDKGHCIALYVFKRTHCWLFGSARVLSLNSLLSNLNLVLQEKQSYFGYFVLTLASWLLLTM